VEIKNQIDPGAIDAYSKEQKFWFEQTETKEEEELQIENNLEKDQINKTNVKSDIRFELKGVDFSGNTIVQSNDLDKFFEPLIGQEIGFDEILNKISDITKVYQLMGYITSKAYIPPQKITDGIIKINIIEGKIAQIEINETKWAKPSYIKNNLIASNDLQESKIFNVNNLKTALNEINDKEYLKGKVVLKRGDAPETTDIIFKVKDRFPLNFSPSWDNFGRDYTGVQRAGINFSNQNITGFGDTLNNTIDLSEGIFGINTKYAVPLGSKGVELQVGYSYNDIKIGQELAPEKIKGLSHGLKAALVFPLYKKDDLKLTSDVAYEMLSSKT